MKGLLIVAIIVQVCFGIVDYLKGSAKYDISKYKDALGYWVVIYQTSASMIKTGNAAHVLDASAGLKDTLKEGCRLRADIFDALLALDSNAEVDVNLIDDDLLITAWNEKNIGEIKASAVNVDTLPDYKNPTVADGHADRKIILASHADPCRINVFLTDGEVAE